MDMIIDVLLLVLFSLAFLSVLMLFGFLHNHPMMSAGISWLLAVLLFFFYMIFVFLDVAEDKSGVQLIVALLAKLGEIIVIPVVLVVIQGDTYRKNKYKQEKGKLSKTKTVTTETVKIDFNGVEHYEKITTVTEEN